MARHRVGRAEDFPVHGVKAVDVGGIDVAIVTVGDDWYGIQNRCPHKGQPLATGPFHPDEPVEGRISRETCAIRCPWHRLEWGLVDGTNDVMGVAIATFDVEVDDGVVYVEI